MTWDYRDDRPRNSYMPCTNCRGKKVDPKKRTRKCPTCNGTGHSDRCDKCNKKVFVVGATEEENKGCCTCYMLHKDDFRLRGTMRT